MKATNNSATKYLKELAMIMKSAHPLQAQWHKQRADDAKAVKIELSYPVIGNERRKKIHQKGIQAHQCYRNATRVAELYGFNYCEGIVMINGVPIEHAFNSYTDKNGKKHYFDFTFEMALITDPQKYEYAVLGEYKYIDVLNICAETGVYGEIYRYKYQKNLSPNNNKRGEENQML